MRCSLQVSISEASIAQFSAPSSEPAKSQLDVALVQPEGELVNVPAQMLRAGVMVDAENAPLHDREDALDTVGRHVAAHELAGAVIDRLVIEEQPGETTVGSELVSVQHGADFDILVDLR